MTKIIFLCIFYNFISLDVCYVFSAIIMLYFTFLIKSMQYSFMANVQLRLFLLVDIHYDNYKIIFFLSLNFYLSFHIISLA